MKASVIILSWNGKDYLGPCLDAVLAQAYPDIEVIVVDNASADGSADFVAERYPQVRLVRNPLNLGFAGGNNVGLASATGDVMILLNQDTVVQPGWLAAFMDAFQTYPDAGVVGAKILDMDGCTLQHAGGYVERPLVLGHHYGYGETDTGQYDAPREVEFVTGAALALKHEVYKVIGGLDEGFYPGYFEDVDFCYRARDAGYTVRYVPEAVLWHHESASMRREAYRGHCAYYRNRLRFVLKHDALEAIAEAFMPAEMARIAEIPLDELRALMASLLAAIVFWPEVAWQREPSPARAQYKAALDALHALYEAAVRRRAEFGAESAAISAPVLPTPDVEAQEAVWFAGDLPQQLHKEFTALNGAWQVTPRPFESDVPVVGDLIVAFRDMVNNLATRWYVEHILKQQVAFNANVVRLLNAEYEQRRQVLRDVAYIARRQAIQLQNHDERLQYQTQQIYDQAQHDLATVEQLAALQRRLLTLEAKVSQLEEKLDE